MKRRKEKFKTIETKTILLSVNFDRKMLIKQSSYHIMNGVKNIEST
jgi:hypothetical protein